jgi:hypothetical protein
MNRNHFISKRTVHQILLISMGVIFFTVIVTTSNAQIALGIRGGVSIPNLTSGGSEQNQLNTGYSSRLGPEFGILAEFKISDLFSLQPMVEYSSQGGKKDGFQAFPTPAAAIPYFPPGEAPTYLWADFNGRVILNYLRVPALAKFGHTFKSSPWRVYIDAGPFVGFLLSAKQNTSGYGTVYADQEKQQPLGNESFDSTQSIKNQLNSTNFGVEGNIGLNYRFGGPNNIFLEVGGNYGFLNIQKGSANGKNNTGAATIVLGYSYWIGEK